MGFVEHPGTDFALADGLEKRPAPQLLGRDVQQRNVAHCDAMQHVAPLQRRQQPVQRRGATQRRRHPLRELIHLVFHQRLQRRNHDGQGPATFHPRQRRKLETQ